MESPVRTSVWPDLDLARIAPMPTDQKRRELERMKLGRPPYTYNSMRQSILDILNVAAGPLAALPRTPWNLIATAITSRGGSQLAISANLRVAEGLYHYPTQQNLRGRRKEFLALPIGISQKVVYWSPVLLEIH